MVLDDEGLGVAEARCDACGLCLPACPRDALSLPADPLVAIERRSDASAWVVCERAGAGAQAAPGRPLPCKHAIGVRHLDAMAREGVRRLTILTGDCSACGRAGGFETALAAHAAVRRGAGLASVAGTATADPAAYAQMRRGAERERVDPARRRLFSSLFGAAEAKRSPPEAHAPAKLAYQAPEIAAQACTACDACAGMCPDGALTRRRGEAPAYVLRPELCSGCGLCVDICEAQAVSIRSLGPAAETELALTARRCRACGATFAEPAEAATSEAFCHICRKRNHAKNLYQVIRS
jgi:ferredoxin